MAGDLLVPCCGSTNVENTDLMLICDKLLVGIGFWLHVPDSLKRTLGQDVLRVKTWSKGLRWVLQRNYIVSCDVFHSYVNRDELSHPMPC